MKKQIAALTCAVALALSVPAPALAARQQYPISVEEYTVGSVPHIKKVYQLSLAEDPASIPTEDFEQNGWVYHLMDITQQNEVGVDAKPYTDTVTQDSDTGDMSAVLKQLEAQKEVTTEDGYTGLLVLDHTSVSVKVKGYRTRTKNLSTTRTYPNLSDADLSLIPKTVDSGGKTLTLGDVQWSSTTEGEGEEAVQRFTATASYTGTSTSRTATGYTVTANYTGQVAKPNCEVITYTAIFSGTQMEPEPTPTPEATPTPTETAPEETPDLQTDSTLQAEQDTETNKSPVDWSSLMGCIGGGVGILAAGLYLVQTMKGKKARP